MPATELQLTSLRKIANAHQEGLITSAEMVEAFMFIADANVTVLAEFATWQRQYEQEDAATRLLLLTR